MIQLFTDFTLPWRKSPIDMSDQNPYPPDILSYWLKIFISSAGRVYVLEYKLTNITQKLVCFFFFKKTCPYHVWLSEK